LHDFAVDLAAILGLDTVHKTGVWLLRVFFPPSPHIWEALDDFLPLFKHKKGVGSVRDCAKFKNKLMGVMVLFLTCRENKQSGIGTRYQIAGEING
jgi:hypothetical protein